jgi:hypothetical protein
MLIVHRGTFVAGYDGKCENGKDEKYSETGLEHEGEK